MCMAVRYGDQVLGNLGELVSSGLISDEHIPSDPELAQMGVDVREVCFCSIDVEAVLADARVHFTLDPDWGDILIQPATPATAPAG